MKKKIIRQFLTLFILIGVFGCKTESTKYSKQFELFKKEFPDSQAVVLDKIVQSYNAFLSTNYPNQKSIGARTESYLLSLESNNNIMLFDTSWIFETIKNIEILKQLEDSGLRKEFYLWGYERDINPYREMYQNWLSDSIERVNPISSISEYDYLMHIQEFDSAQFINTESKFVRAFKKYLNNPNMNTYFKAFYEEDNMSPSVLAVGLAKEFSTGELSNPIIQLLIFREFYNSQMVMDIERTKGHNIK
jgi:hypothetical protein